MRRALVFIAAIVPLVVDWCLKVLVFPRPFWIQYYDPETIYFYSGLRMLRGLVPENVDNPGTPLQMLSAVIALFTGRSPLQYERFIVVAHTLALLAAIAAIVLLLCTILRDAPPLLQIAGAWLYFLAPQALERDDIWSPEWLLFPAAVVALALLWRWRRDPSPSRAALAGIAIGAGIAVKFVFLGWAPAVILAMLVARRVRDAFTAAIGIALGFLVATLPIMRVYDLMIARLVALSAGGRDADLSWSTLFTTARLWVFILMVIAIGATRIRREQLPFVVFALSAIAFTFIGARTNLNFRYLLPAGLAMIAIFAVFASTKPRVAWQFAIIALFTIAMAKTIANDVAAHRRRIAEGVEARATIERAVPRDGVVVYSWRMPIPSFALSVMTTERRYHDELAKRWPRDGSFNDWTHTIYLPPGAKRWDYLVISPEMRREFPERIGPYVANAGAYDVYRAP